MKIIKLFFRKYSTSRRESKSRNGANHSLFGSANKACVAGVQKGYGWHFGRPFLVHFLGEQKMNNIPFKI
jgi:hypothetical protein